MTIVFNGEFVQCQQGEDCIIVNVTNLEPSLFNVFGFIFSDLFVGTQKVTANS